MGSVFVCKNALSDRIRAAVKIIKPHGLDAAERFVREAEALYALRHPAIVRVTGFGEDKDRKLLWLAMELVDGDDLSKHLASAPLDPNTAQVLFRQFAEGLEHAHTRGIFHRDIKPANLTLNTDGEGVILDFGIAVSSGRTKLTQEGLVPGTLQYMPPEVFEGELSVPQKTDIYSLGLVLYEALVGKPAFEEDPNSSDSHQMVRMMSMKLNSHRFDPGPQFPSALRNAISMATEPDPNQRLSNMTDFVRLLNNESLDSPFPVAAHTEPVESTNTHWAQKSSTGVQIPSKASKAKWWVGGFMVTLSLILLLAIIGVGIVAALIFAPTVEEEVHTKDHSTTIEGFIEMCEAGSEHAEKEAWHTIEMVKKVSGTVSCDTAKQALEREEGINLSGLQIQDLSPIAGTSPIRLTLNNNRITQIDSLAQFTHLKHIALNNNRVKKVDALKELKALESVSLNHNQIKDLSPLQSLENVTELGLRDNQIHDITPLKALKALKEVSLDGNPILRTFCPVEADVVAAVRTYCTAQFAVKRDTSTTDETTKPKEDLPIANQDKREQAEVPPPSKSLSGLSQNIIQKISDSNVTIDKKEEPTVPTPFEPPDCNEAENQSPNSYKSLLSWAKGKLGQVKQGYNRAYHCSQAKGLANQAYCKDKAALPILKEIHTLCTAK